MLVAIEGIDGSGKGTQAAMLMQRCIRERITSAKIAFPQYGRSLFAQAIKEYLHGDYGSLREVHPKLAAVLFAGDRFASRELLLEACRCNSVVVCDRYVSSNLAHQAAKLSDDERVPFIEWLSGIEFDIFKMPVADLNIYLDVPVKHAKRLVHKKAPRDQHSLFAGTEQDAYTSLKADIHERDGIYLASCRHVYQELVDRQVGGQWISISCVTSNDQMRPLEQIADEVFAHVRSKLVCDLPLEGEEVKDIEKRRLQY